MIKSNKLGIKNEEMSIKVDRAKILLAIRNYKNFKTDAAFARFLGLSPNTVSNWYARNSFNAEILLNKIPELSSTWLLTGEGPMLATQRSEHETAYQESGDRRPATAELVERLLQRIDNLLQRMEENDRREKLYQQQINRLITLLEKR